LCRWSFDLGVLSSSLLIAMISALPLWSFPYLFCLSFECKGNPCINFTWFFSNVSLLIFDFR
jgi:hypothetical protein